MSLEHPTNVLKKELDSDLQKISKDGDFHLNEDLNLLRNQTNPHPQMKDNFDFMMNPDTDTIQDSDMESEQELKRNSTKVNSENMDTTFKPITATCKLFSNKFENGFQAKNGLSQPSTR